MSGADERAGDPTWHIEREEFARGHIAPGEEPVAPRLAATVILLREGEGGPEALLLRRPGAARFAAGAYVFPGGTIDPEDEDPELLALLRPGDAAREGPALIAGLRELFEEVGYLPADRPPPAELRRAARTDLLAGRRGFAEIARDLELVFHELRAAYVARWVTPPSLSRRYDAHFFAVDGTGAPDPELTDELTDFVWLRPAEAVARFEAGRLRMLFPTRVTLERLSVHPSVDSLLRAARGREVHPILPKLLVRGDSVWPVLPGDPGYEIAGP